jgi:hypothetical protein
MHQNDQISNYRSIIKFPVLLGLSLVVLGVLLPAEKLLEILRSSPDGVEPQFILGGYLFKVGISLLGLLTIALSSLSTWKNLKSAENKPHEPHHKIILTILSTILLLAFFMRLYSLNSGLWLDEIITFVRYARLSFGEIITTFDSENQHFLYSVLSHMSFLTFGENAWALRLPAVLFGVASILALFLLGRTVASTQEALLAAALMAFSYHHVWFSQNARGYTGLLFWTLLSSWLFVRGLEENRPNIWILYAWATAFGIYTHMTMVFVTVGQFLIYLILLISRRNDDWTGRWNGILLGYPLAATLSFLLHSFVIPQILVTIGGTEQSVVDAWKNPIWTLMEISRGLEVSFAGGVIASGAFILFGTGLWGYFREKPIMVGLMLLPSIIGASIVLAIGHHLWPRFFFFAMGFGTLIVIRGIMILSEFAIKFLRKPSQQNKKLGIVVSLGLILVSSLSIPFAYGPKQDYGGALTYVETNRRPGDAVVTVNLTTLTYQEYYQTGWQSISSLEDLDNIRSQSGRTWLLYTFPPVLEAMHPDIMENIKSDFVLVEKFEGTVRGGTVFICLADNSVSDLSTMPVKN